MITNIMKMKYLFALFLFLFSINNSEAQNTSLSYPNDTLKIVSWNIHMLPYFFVLPISKKRKRTKLIGEEFNHNYDYDIIVLQEVFHKTNRRLLKRKLKKKYPYQYGPPNRKRLSLKTNSGLMVFSKRPLIYKASVQFDVATSFDNKLARKGAMLLEGEFNGNLFQIINTHTQGNPPIINGHQFHQIYDGLIEPYEKENVPQLLCGDMNCSSKIPTDYNQMLKIFHIENPAPMYDDRYEKNGGLLGRTIDYILVRPNNSGMKIIRTSKILIGPDWKKTKAVGKKFGVHCGLSDHYPMEIQVVW